MKFLNVTRRNVKVAAGMVGGLLFMQTLIAPVAYAGPPARKFYRTQTTFDGAHALTACVLGFHMASLWEIFNVSVLEYDTSLGATMDDSGSGPPADVLGWIRTGFNSNGGDPLRARLTAACGHRVRPPTAAALSLWNPFGTRLP